MPPPLLFTELILIPLKHLFLPPGCTLLFYETYGKGSPEQETLPSYALLAEDGIVQAVPEHPKKENVFCLSNAYGDVYLFQVGPEHWSCIRVILEKSLDLHTSLQL